MALDLDGANDLAQLCTERSLDARLQQPRHLHGEGRTAGYDVSMGNYLRRRPHQGEDIDAGMLAKPLVFVGGQQCEIPGIDAVGTRRQTPAALRGRVGPQQPAVAIHHGGRELQPIPERGGTERSDPHGYNARRDQYRAPGDRDDDRCQRHPSAARPVSQFRAPGLRFVGGGRPDPPVDSGAPLPAPTSAPTSPQWEASNRSFITCSQRAAVISIVPVLVRP